MPLTSDGHPVHPLGSRARVLLSSVFGPYARDDEYGSRAINPMELYHNQVTREQGVFSLRMFHRVLGPDADPGQHRSALHAAGLPDARPLRSRSSRTQRLRRGGHRRDPCPTSPRSRRCAGWCAQPRPQATIVVGGHVANHPRRRASAIGADHVVQRRGRRAGSAASWARTRTGPIRHPLIYVRLRHAHAGRDRRGPPGDIAATLIPSVGCPLGCNFCATSAMFGGKGRFVDVLSRRGDELFDVMRPAREARWGCARSS